MRTGAIIACIFMLGGCAETELPVRNPLPLADTRPPAPAVADSFDRYEMQDEATRPPPRPRQTISLGFVGNEPLSNSVMRDTPIDPPQWQGQGQTWQQYIQTPSWPPYRPPSEYGPAPRVCACTR